MHDLAAWHCMCLFEEHLDGVDETQAILCDSVSNKLVKIDQTQKKTSKIQGEVFSRYFSRLKLWGFLFTPANPFSV